MLSTAALFMGRGGGWSMGIGAANHAGRGQWGEGVLRWLLLVPALFGRC